MLKIRAKVYYIPRAQVVAPLDGVHINGAHGFIKGVHSLWFKTKDAQYRLVPKGATSMYWRLDADTGLRVGYSFKWFVDLRRRQVERDYDLMRKAFKMGIAPQSFGVERIDMILKYHQEGHLTKKLYCNPYAIRVQHIHYPEAAWQRYAEGYPYDWAAVDHPDHNPDGFNRFRNSIKPAVKELGLDTSLKLGDILFCTKTNRYYLVDTGK